MFSENAIMLFILAFSTLSLAHSCDFYLGKSRLHQAGRGIFAGRDFNAEEDIFSLSVLFSPNKGSHKWSINNYVYGSPDINYNLIIPGEAMLFNHKPYGQSNLRYFWKDEEEYSTVIDEAILPSSNYSKVTFRTTQRVFAGEELFCTYGNESWFLDRGIPLDDAHYHIDDTKYSLNDLDKNAYCLSDVYIDASTLPNAGYGLFARKTFHAGDIVTIAPVLFLPKTEIEQLFDSTNIANYCLTSNTSKVALFPIGRISYANHGGVKYANLNISWLNWKNDETLSQLYNTELDDLMAMKYAPLDLKFTASKSILEGEEMLLDYGKQWSSEYDSYIQTLIRNSVRYNDIRSIQPLFRQFIHVPEELFPIAWNDGEQYRNGSVMAVKNTCSHNGCAN